MMWKKLLAPVSAVAILILAAQPIFAQKEFLVQLKGMHAENKATLNCATCHTFSKEKKEHPNKDNINLYGKELQAADTGKVFTNIKEGDEHKFTDDEKKAIKTALAAIEGKDSNGNGKTNAEDIKAGVNPGVK